MAYDARRRNRNIGTAKSGHGQSNKLTIPSRWTEDRVFYEVLEGPFEFLCMVPNDPDEIKLLEDGC